MHLRVGPKVECITRPLRVALWMFSGFGSNGTVRVLLALVLRAGTSPVRVNRRSGICRAVCKEKAITLVARAQCPVAANLWWSHQLIAHS